MVSVKKFDVIVKVLMWCQLFLSLYGLWGIETVCSVNESICSLQISLCLSHGFLSVFIICRHLCLCMDDEMSAVVSNFIQSYSVVAMIFLVIKYFICIPLLYEEPVEQAQKVIALAWTTFSLLIVTILLECATTIYAQCMDMRMEGIHERELLMIEEMTHGDEECVVVHVTVNKN